jgi:SPP1 family phage portal protein
MLSIEEIGRMIDDDRTSVQKAYARKAFDYYEAEHDIRFYRIFYRNGDGELVEDKNRSNARIAHPFFTELIDQQVQYMLSDDGFISSGISELAQDLEKYFDDSFRSELAETLTDTCVYGWGYMYGYVGDKGHIEFSATPSLNVIEVRAKDTQENADHVIYYYDDYVTDTKKTVRRIEVWDKTYISYYVQVDDGEIEWDENAAINPRPHKVWREPDSAELKGMGLGFIPFWRLDNNRKKSSNLKPIKGLIDDYDLMSCSLTNNLVDFDSPLYAVKGFDGDDVGELIENIKAKRHIGLPDGGDVDVKTIEVPYQARVTKMAEDERNIYRFGMGLNSAQAGDGNITNVVIKSRYALLDLKCNKLEKYLRRFIQELLEVALNEINANRGTAYTYADVDVDFKREVMANALDNAQIASIEAQAESARVGTLLNAAALLGEDEALKQICGVLDIDPEGIERITPEGATKEAEQVLRGSRSMYPITSVLQKYSNGKLTRNNAVKMLKMLGVSEEEAAAMLDDKDDLYELTGA